MSILRDLRTKKLKCTSNLLECLLISDMVWNDESESTIVHEHEFARVSNTINRHILLKVKQSEVEQIIDLAELHILVKVLGADLVHEVLQLMLQSRALKLLKCREHPLPQSVSTTRFKPEKSVIDLETRVILQE